MIRIALVVAVCGALIAAGAAFLFARGRDAEATHNNQIQVGDVNDDGVINFPGDVITLAKMAYGLAPTPAPIVIAPFSTYWATGERPLCTGGNPVECLGAEAFCDLGDILLGGGGQGPFDLVAHPGAAVTQSFPVLAVDGRKGWHIVVEAPYGGDFTGYAICSDNPPSHVTLPTATSTPTSTPVLTPTPTNTSQSAQCVFGGLVGTRWVSGNGHCYGMFTDSKVFADARADCESLGGYLATLTSAEEDAFVWSLAVTSPRYPLIGLTDEILEDEFQWVSGEPVNYTNFAGFAVGDDGDAVLLTLNSGKWYEYSTQLANPYICEKP